MFAKSQLRSSPGVLVALVEDGFRVRLFGEQYVVPPLWTSAFHGAPDKPVSQGLAGKPFTSSSKLRWVS